MKIKLIRTPKKVRIIRSSRYWSTHTHSRFSANDAMPSVADIVARAKELRYPGLGLTDHGNMAGTVQLYQECKKAGIKPFPGTEIYLVRDRKDKSAKRYHACVLAYSNEGYLNLVKMNTRSAQQFHFKPILDLADLAEMADAGQTRGLALTTGCYFGMVVQTLISDGYQAAKGLVATMAQWFPGSTYVELQRHNIDQEPLSETLIETFLHGIAKELGLKCILTQDSHYIHPEDRPDHDAMKRLVSWSPDADEAVFPGDGYHMVDDAWMKEHHGETYYEAGLEGLDDLLWKHSLTIPQLDEYDYLVPSTSVNPAEELALRCDEQLALRGLNKPIYRERLAKELDIVGFSGMEAYLLLVAKVTDYCRAKQIFFQARGSASGSLICYLLGITALDPLKWSLIMERFLSKDRTKPPDVDLDVESDRRKELLDWLNTQFSALQIGTWLTYSMEGEEDGKGSIKVRFFSSQKKQGKATDWKQVDPEVKHQLYRLSDMKLVSGYGVHAAGVLLTSTRAQMEHLVPQMYVASSKTMVSQYDMKDVEKLGLVKLDVLGLKTMSVLRQTVINMGRDPRDGLDWIPLSDSKTFTSMANGRVAGVFQLEGGTSARGIRELHPTNIHDVIASMALFRPATMNSGATNDYIMRKHKQAATPQRHEIIDRHTKATYGILLYQDQVIAVLRDLGMDPDRLTKFLKAVKASNDNVAEAAKTIEGLMEQIRDMCVEHGMGESDFNWLKEALHAYANYGFNQAHATMYGITAYRCAWLAENQPLEFHAALLAVAAGTKKEPEYITATRKRGLRVLKPDVNLSGVTYQMDRSRNGIRRGLLAITGVGKVSAAAIVAGQPFASLEDFAEKVNPSKVTGTKDMPKTDEEFRTAADQELLVGIVSKLAAAEAFNSILSEV